MTDLSYHTHQINLWIALASFEPTFSHTLGQYGYECDVVEKQFYLRTEEGEQTVHPDVVLSSSSHNYALVVDCKSESISEEQLRRYLLVDGNEEQLVTQGLVEGVSPSALSQDVTVSSFSDLSTDDITERIALVHFKHSPSSGLSVWNPEDYAFEHSEVKEAFPINVDPDQPLPTSYYPFDTYAGDKEAMVSSVLSSILSLAIKQGSFSIEDLLNKSHPYWDKIGNDKKRELRERVEIVHRELLEAGLDEHLEKVAGTNGREWQIASKTIQAIHDKTDYYVDRVLDNLPQARLDHEPWSSQDSDEGVGAN